VTGVPVIGSEWVTGVSGAPGVPKCAYFDPENPATEDPPDLTGAPKRQVAPIPV
jgi:hypothetical protein